MQAQGHVQLLMNLLFRGMDPQAAIDAPRFCIFDGKANGKIGVEPWTSEDEGTEATAVTDRGEDGQRAGVVNVLRRMGHSVVVRGGHDRAEMGRAQVGKPSEKKRLGFGRWRSAIRIYSIFLLSIGHEDKFVCFSHRLLIL